MTAALSVARQTSKERPTDMFSVTEVVIRDDVKRKELILALLRGAAYSVEDRQIAVFVGGRKRMEDAA
jgi:hypothetical protein